MQLVDGNITYAQNLYFSGDQPCFVKEIPDDYIKGMNKQVVHIKKPVISIEVLHSCYVHALEDVFRIHWTLRELKRLQLIPDDDVVFFVRKDLLLQYIQQSIKRIDLRNNCFKGAWNKLFNVINKNEIIFEILVDDNIVYHFDHLFVLSSQDGYQHSFWNSHIYYPGREQSQQFLEQNRHLLKYAVLYKDQLISHVRYTDAQIKEELLAFRTSVLNTYLKTYDVPQEGKRKLVIIDRKLNRVFPPAFVKQMDSYFQQFPKVEYKGTFYLETLSFEEQLNLFNTNDIFVMVHGAGCGNILWSKKGSILVQFDEAKNRFIMYDRLALLVGVTSYNIVFSEFQSLNLFDLLPL